MPDTAHGCSLECCARCPCSTSSCCAVVTPLPGVLKCATLTPTPFLSAGTGNAEPALFLVGAGPLKLTGYARKMSLVDWCAA
jgi:hypothetical protein